MLTINSRLSTVYIGNHILFNVLKNMSKTSRLFVICDKNILKKITVLKKISKFIFCNSFSEDKKNINTVVNIVKTLIKYNINKNDYVVIIGGGTLLDTACFASSIYKRGVPFINVPSTFLSAIDAGIGGKNGVNFNDVKNVVGTVTQPKYILIDLQFLNQNTIKEGVGELLKYAMIMGYDFYKFISKNKQNIVQCNIASIQKIIYECVKFKLKVVEKDQFDSNLRHILNFGHTAGHLIEGLSNFKISHSNAIIRGMEIELLCAKKYNLISDSFLSHFYMLKQGWYSAKKQLAPRWGLPLTLSRGLPLTSIRGRNDRMRLFKKLLSNDKKVATTDMVVLSLPTNFNKYNLFFKVPLPEFYKVFTHSI